GSSQPVHCDRICTARSLCPPKAGENVLCVHPADGPGGPAGQRGPHPGEHPRRPPAHAHVLLPGEPLLPGRLLHHLLGPPHSRQLPDPQEEHPLLSLCGADVSLLCHGSHECVLLSMMAFDRYVAICSPLRYPVVMSKALYTSMAISSWVAGIITATVQLPFCGDNVINHFTCEILAVLKLACADISINVISMGVANMIFLGVPVLFIFVSYTFILTTILRIPSAEGRRKAFSTCSAHLTVVIVFYGTILFMYGKPKSKDPLGADKQDLADQLISLFYGVVTPMLNPIIYSLSNKDVRAAVWNLVGLKCLTQ
ncbi:Olfactory receptor 13C7, partial [Lemmus lemmus]